MFKQWWIKNRQNSLLFLSWGRPLHWLHSDAHHYSIYRCHNGRHILYHASHFQMSRIKVWASFGDSATKIRLQLSITFNAKPLSDIIQNDIMALEKQTRWKWLPFGPKCSNLHFSWTAVIRLTCFQTNRYSLKTSSKCDGASWHLYITVVLNSRLGT